MTTTPLPELTFYRHLDKELITVVIQQRKTLEVLMVGAMSKESLALMQENDIIDLFALSRNELWLKGEKSDIHLNVKEIRVNCNNTNLLVLVDYESNICHTGTPTCFYRRLTKRDGNWVWNMKEEGEN